MWNQKRDTRYFLFAGRAYPNIIPKKNTTTQVRSQIDNREQYYRDDAVVISESNLDKWNGTEGYPVCVEHNLKDVVGTIHHTWLTDNSLKIQGRIELFDERGNPNERGQQIAQGIRDGTYKGLSVGYSVNVNKSNGYLRGKEFREISIVKEPFFGDCTLSVVASKNSDKNTQTLIFPQNNSIYVPIFATMENTTTPAAAAAAPEPAVSSSELLSQADALKALTVEQANKLKEAEAKLAMFEAKAKQEAEAYAAAQKPKLEAFLQEVSASAKLEDRMIKGYTQTFLDINYRDGARELERQFNERVEMRASKAAAEKRVQELEEDKKRLEEAVAKTSQVLNMSRYGVSSPQQQDDFDSSRRKVDTQQKLELGHIMCPAPSAIEIPFLAQYGYGSSSSDVNASAGSSNNNNYMYSVPSAPIHSNLKDHEGNLNFPNSMRAHASGLFGFATNTSVFDGDLSDLARVTITQEERLANTGKN